MKRYMVVEAAIVLVIENLEVNHISCDTESIRNRVYSWYSNSDVTDPEILAACALEGKDWFPGATYQQMLNAKEQWFLQNPYEEFSIWEIEAAQHDMMWR